MLTGKDIDTIKTSIDFYRQKVTGYTDDQYMVELRRRVSSNPGELTSTEMHLIGTVLRDGIKYVVTVDHLPETMQDLQNALKDITELITLGNKE